MHKLQKVLEILEYNTRSYSGRGMFNKTCLAITGDLNLFRLGLEVAEYLADTNDSEITEAMKNCREDQMGRGTVLYWPQIPFAGEDEEDEEDTEDENG